MAPTFIAPVSFGLGDLVVSLPAVQGLVRDGRETWLVARSASQAALAPRIDGLAGCVAEDTFTPGAADYVNLRDHPLQRDAWWGSEAFERRHGQLTINEILARVCADLDVPADFTAPRALRYEARAGLEDTVMLIADTDGPAKRWPEAAWRALAASVADRGLRPVVLTGGGEASASLAGDGLAAVPAPTVGAVVDVLTAAAAVVGVDSGLTHLAVQQGTPTVALHRHPAMFHRPWPRSRAVVAPPCEPVCIERWMAGAHHDAVDHPARRFRPWDCVVGGRCMVAISPAAAAAALDEVLPS